MSDYLPTKKQDKEAIEHFVAWLIENQELDNAWWFDGWVNHMLEKYQSLHQRRKTLCEHNWVELHIKTSEKQQDWVNCLECNNNIPKYRIFELWDIIQSSTPTPTPN